MRLGELTALPLAGFKGEAAGSGRGREERRREGSGKGEVDCDVQLEQGRRLAKAGPAFHCINFCFNGLPAVEYTMTKLYDSARECFQPVTRQCWLK